MAISLNDNELEALAGLPHSVICLYVMAIRPRMDFSTGLVGVRPRISWQALTEWLYIEPHQGIKSGSPGKSAVRRAAEALERAGLIKIGSQGKQLLFKCLLANRGKLTPNKPDTNPTHQPDTPKPAPVLEPQQQADIPETPKADTHPISDLSIYSPPPNIDTSKGVVVEFAQQIKPENRPAIEGYLKHVAEQDRQTILDDLVGFISSERGQGRTVANPGGVMRRMVERYKAGEWVPERAHIGKALRQQEKQQQQQQSRTEQPKENKPRITPKTSLKDALRLLSVET